MRASVLESACYVHYIIAPDSACFYGEKKTRQNYEFWSMFY